MGRAAIFFGVVAWLASVALAFMIGRATAPVPVHSQPSAVETSPPSVARSLPLPIRAPSPKASPSAAEAYPKYSSTIPAAFRGSWDEIVSDRCEGREARFMIAAKTIANFEVQSDVERVKLYSPTEIDVDLTGYDENKDQYNQTMEFKLVDGGKTLTGRKKGATYFHKCP